MAEKNDKKPQQDTGRDALIPWHLIPDNLTLIDAIIVAKVLDEDGCVALMFTSTNDITHWEGLGMLEAVKLDWINQHAASFGLEPEDEENEDEPE